MSPCRNLQQMRFKGLLHEGNANVKSIDSLLSTECHKLTTSTGGKVWWRRKQWGTQQIFVYLSLWNTHARLFFLGAPSPPQREIAAFIHCGLGFLGYLNNVVSVAPCNASIRCHNSWGDQVNGCAVFPRGAGMDRPGFVSARNRRRLQQSSALRHLCARSRREGVDSSPYFWFGAVRHFHWGWAWTRGLPSYCYLVDDEGRDHS